MTISDLIAQRERAMDRADAALDKAWPARQGAAYLKAMQDAAAEIQRVAAALQTAGASAFVVCGFRRERLQNSLVELGSLEI